MNEVRIILENGMTMDCELYEDIAPISVENFLSLVDKKFYDGICFHRIIKGFMAQCGGFVCDGKSLEEKKSGTEPIRGEFESNGFKNPLKHTKGVLSMARTSDKNSATSQIFIMTSVSPHLDGEYAAFGKVKDQDMKTVDYLNNAKTVNVGGGLTDFPYPEIIRIKTIERI